MYEQGPREVREVRQDVTYSQVPGERREVVYQTGPQYEQKYYSSYPAGEVTHQTTTEYVSRP